jgi:hypothetical protein
VHTIDAAFAVAHPGGSPEYANEYGVAPPPTVVVIVVELPVASELGVAESET